jgi:hypothetical protein
MKNLKRIMQEKEIELSNSKIQVEVLILFKA